MSKLDDAYNYVKALVGHHYDGSTDVPRAHLQALLNVAEDAEWYREILHDLCNDECEKRAIGGGPNWQERHEKNWARAMELFEP